MKKILLLIFASANALAAVSLGEPVGSAPLFPPAIFENTYAQALAVSSPDNSQQAVSAFFRNAKYSIRLEGYTLESDELADELVAACKRGVKVKVLLDGWPAVRPTVEKISKQTLYIAKRIKDAGCLVLFLASKDSQRTDRRYRWVHSKFFVVDDNVLYVSSENFSPKTGHPVNPSSGNRGWSLALQHVGIAKDFVKVFEQDANRKYKDLVAYGQNVCTTAYPKCGKCVIEKYCIYDKKDLKRV